VQNKGYKQQSLVYREKGIIEGQIIHFIFLEGQFIPFISLLIYLFKSKVHRCLESMPTALQNTRSQAVTEFNDFMLTGWKGNALQLAANCANSLSDDVELVPGSKRKRKEVASVDQRGRRVLPFGMN
jgi:hypothetical protein